MKLGITLPQGCDREYLGLDARRAWDRTVDVARTAEALGFESVWVYDHFQVDPPLIEAPIFEPFVELSALAMATSRVRLGHLVMAAAYRNAALTAKMISTLDVVSGGRAELGIGAGWKEDEWLAYGYGFPDTAERLAILADHLEIISRMLAPGRATWDGRHASVHDAIHEPKGLQDPRLPILIGGNGPKVTWRSGRPVRGRAEPRRAHARRGSARATGDRRTLHGDRPRTGVAARVGPCLGSARRGGSGSRAARASCAITRRLA